VIGELYIGGTGVSRGYLNRPELTSDRFIADLFNCDPEARLYKTGDLARYLEDGNIEFLGRNDFQVKIRGFRVELGEIEAALAACDGVREAVVAASEDVPGEKRLVAYLVPAEGANLSLTTLREQLISAMPEYMVPAVFIILDALPLTPNGKVNNQALPASGRRLLHDNHIPPRTEIEQKMIEVWKNVLSVNQIGITDNFFELGGDSILSIRLVAKTRQADIFITPRQLFKYPTIEKLAQHARIEKNSLTPQEEIFGEQILLPIQRQFLSTDNIDRNHYNQSLLLKIPHDFTYETLKEFISKLYLRHDILRLEVDGMNARYLPPSENFVSRAIRYCNLRDFDAAAWDVEIARLGQEIKSGLALQDADIFRVLFIDGKDDKRRILLTFHHIVIDGISWRILLQDLMLAYAQWGEQKNIQLPPKSSSFQDWGKFLFDYANDEALEAEKMYWIQQAAIPVAPLPLDLKTGMDATFATSDSISTALTETETADILHACNFSYQVRINDLLLSALYLTLQTWTGQHAFRIDLEGHGREALSEQFDLSETMGWFTSIYPVILKASPSARIDEVINSIRHQLASIPANGIGFGLLSELSTDSEVKNRYSEKSKDILFNYLGQFDQTINSDTPFQPASEWAGHDVSNRCKRDYLLEINGMLSNKKLTFAISYSKNNYNAETIELLADTLNLSFKKIIAHHHSLVKPAGKPNERKTIPINPTVNYLHLNQGWGTHFGTSVAFQWSKEQVKADILEKAVHRVVSMHEALQIKISKNEICLEQSVLPLSENDSLLIIEDMTHVDDVDFDSTFISICDKWSASFLFDGKDHLFRFVYIKCNKDRGDRIFMVFHHMVIDGESSHIILGDLLQSYRNIESGLSQPISQRPSYSAWIDQYFELMRMQKDRDIAFWKGLPWEKLSDIRNSTAPTPVESDSPPRIFVSEDITSKLLALKDSNGSSAFIESIILVIIYGMYPWLTNDMVLFEMVMNNRTLLGQNFDTSELVGNLTTNNVIPVFVNNNFSDLSKLDIEEISSQQRQVPNNGRGLLHALYSSNDLPDIVYRPLVGVNVTFLDSDMESKNDNSKFHSIDNGESMKRNENNGNIHAIFFDLAIFRNAMRLSAYTNNQRCSSYLADLINMRAFKAMEYIANKNFSV
jgi:non-ribosomal peptide synthase protein (TIGR01720 family)